MPENPRPSGTVAFLFTDIEGSTKRWQAHAAAMGDAVARHDALLRQAIEVRGGYVFKTVGDAFCAAFATAPLALAAALEAQRGLGAVEWGALGPLRVRMGIHVGAAEEREGDYFGPAVNRVARLLSAGHGGQVLLSLPAAELVRDSLPADIALSDLGEHRLKDLARPERIFQLVAPDLTASFPSLVTLDAHPHNLPTQLTPFLGREQEAARVRDLLERSDVRLVTLTGPGGTGKTRLVLQVAADLVEGYSDGAWFVELEEATDEALVVAAIARALGVRETGGHPLFDSLLDFLKAKRLLLVLDNFEQVAHAAPLVSRMLVAAPDVKVLVSSRIRLGIRGEHEYRVPPLGVPPRVDRSATPEHLAQYEAVRLFVERAQAAKVGFELTADNAAAVATICRDLDGLPLAIELAAARVRMLPPQAMAKRLEDRLGLAVGGGRDRPERQQTLRGAIVWSHDLLPVDQQRLFAHLGVFAGGWDFEGAEAVVNRDGDLDVFSGLEALVDHSLVRQEETADGEVRFSMLATIRAFAKEQLDQAAGGEAEQIRMLHAEHFLALAEEAEPQLTGPDQVVWLGRLDAEHDNLRVALGWFGEAGQAEQELRFAASLWRFWDTRGYLSEGRQRLDRAMTQFDGADPALRAKVLKGAGALAHHQGDYARAREMHEQELAENRAAGDQRGMAQALINLGSVAIHQGDYEQATSYLEESLVICRGSNDRMNLSVALNWLGAIAFLQGGYDRATTLYEESLALSRQLQHKQGMALSLVNLAEARQYQGDLERAMGLYEQALPLFRELGDTRHAAFALHGLGVMALTRGDVGSARDYLGQSLTHSQDLGDRVAVADCLEWLAQVAVAEENFVRAVRVFGAADALRQATGAPRPQADAAEYDLHISLARAILGPDGFATGWEAGQRLSADEAVAEATGRESDARAESLTAVN